MANSTGYILAFATLIAAGLVGVVVLPTAARWNIGNRGMALFGPRRPANSTWSPIAVAYSRSGLAETVRY